MEEERLGVGVVGGGGGMVGGAGAGGIRAKDEPEEP